MTEDNAALLLVSTEGDGGHVYFILQDLSGKQAAKSKAKSSSRESADPRYFRWPSNRLHLTFAPNTLR